MHKGWIYISTKDKDHCLFNKPLIWHLWVYLRLKASTEFIDFHLENLKYSLMPGQLFTNLQQLKISTGLSIQNIRTALRTLENHKMIARQVFRNGTLITINRDYGELMNVEAA